MNAVVDGVRGDCPDEGELRESAWGEVVLVDEYCGDGEAYGVVKWVPERFGGI